MLARHPLTGKDIRIMKADTILWKDQKTLVWFDDAPPPGTAWSRWNLGVTSVKAATALEKAGYTPDVVVCINDYDQLLEWCKAGNWSRVKLVAVPRSFVERVGIEQLLKIRMTNLLCLDEIDHLYPFVEKPWDGSMDDAKFIVSLILRCGKAFPVKNVGNRNPFSMKVQEEMLKPQPLWLVTQYYVPEKGRRRKEIEACLQKNIECDAIDKIVLLNETFCAPKHAKIQESIVRMRLTYETVIRWIYELAPRDTIIAFANADIFLDNDSWRNIWSMDLEGVPKFLALLRWNVETTDTADAKLFGPRADSQDTWVVSSNAVKAVTWDWSALNFPFGQGGCDNAITIEMFKKRFLVSNPALTLKTYHLHSSEVRTYNPRNIVDKPMYMHVNPSGLNDMKPVINVDTVAKPITLKPTPFARRIRGTITDRQARTLCTMLRRNTENRIDFEPDSENIWSPPPIPLYKMNDVFQSREGLVYTYDSIIIGKTASSAKAWAHSQLSSLSASMKSGEAVAAPLSDSTAMNPGKYVLEYLSKVLLLKKTYDITESDFWCSKQGDCVKALELFSWDTNDLPLVSRDENQQMWCSSAAIWLPQDNEENLITREEIGVLRESLRGGWETSIQNDTYVIYVDGEWITEEVAEKFEEKLNVTIIWPDTSIDLIAKALRGAAGMIVHNAPLSHWCWLLPKGAQVWDIQSEMAPSIALLHRAAAAELEHRFHIVAKGAPSDADKSALVEAIVAATSSPTVPEVQGVPKIYIPDGHNGFFAHSGDSFREMAKIWEKRGYVECVAKSNIHHVWLGGVGKFLLYDRPTHEWLERGPPKERVWEQGLFGNPAPAKGGISWSFWPRRPELVEAAVENGISKKSWEARDKGIVFYGRSENAVQKARRSTADWSKVCDEFVHIDGISKYAYTQEQYLENLARAKYGLCLAGYGYKCHREIECMAMGCVPIVAPEVDMTNYAEPPQEGLHYLRVQTPEDVLRIKNITAEQWTVMSVAGRDWWERNASAEGMWSLTKTLCGL